MNSSSEFHIFRDSRRRVPAAELVARLGMRISELSCFAHGEELIHALLLAAELECGLADAGAAVGDVAAASRLTSMLADAAVRCDASGELPDAVALAREGQRILRQIRYMGPVGIGVPEGFAYYALHPLDYADLIERPRLEQSRAVVIGIRSIGTTLSAVVCAKLRQLGFEVERITARPTGHPYDRRCDFSVAQRLVIAGVLTRGAEFVVCDEGPGRSGSSLLSVAEALEREGVPAQRILILCSHEPDVSALCTFNAAARWARYRSAAAGTARRLPAAAEVFAGGGEWRRHFLVQAEDWPAVWPQMERLKCLSADGRELFTFEGHGPYGAAVQDRNQALSEAGFGAPYLGQELGFGRHRVQPGRLARQSDLSSELLAHMAEYCAWRAREFSVDAVDSGELEAMTRINFAREFEGEPGDLELPVEYPTVCDNRMRPHHWLLTDGRVLKLDAAIHGDDHFFPGACDIAWDLAGVIVEWNLDSSARESFLKKYRRISYDDASSRIESYELAYAVFRMAWSSMAAASMGESEEKQRLMWDCQRYRMVVQSLVSPLTRLAFVCDSAGADTPA